MNIIKNPIIIGLFFGILTYIYMVYFHSKYIKKYKKNNKTKKKIIYKNPSFFYPIIVFSLSWLIAFIFLDDDDDVNIMKNFNEEKSYELRNDDNENDDSRSFRMLKTGINIPRNLPNQNLPDVFINAI